MATEGQFARARRKQARRDKRRREADYGPAPQGVDCGECGKPCGLVTGETVYPHRPDLAHHRFWRCAAGGARVRCHEGTTTPLGTPAGPETQRARRAAHAAFDPLWERKIAKEGVSKSKARAAGYGWLAAQLGLPIDKTHIGMFDAATATRVVELCQPYQAKGEHHDRGPRRSCPPAGSSHRPQEHAQRPSGEADADDEPPW